MIVGGYQPAAMRGIEEFCSLFPAARLRFPNSDGRYDIGQEAVQTRV